MSTERLTEARAPTESNGRRQHAGFRGPGLITVRRHSALHFLLPSFVTVMSFPIPETKGVKKNDQSFKIIIHSNVHTSDINQSKLKHAFKTEQCFSFFLKNKEEKSITKNIGQN